MPDATPPDPSGAPPRRKSHAFTWTFAGCIALPLVALLSQSLNLLFAVPVAWVLGLFVGTGLIVSGRREVGRAVVLGSLAGATVGFTLCSGLLVVADAAGL